MNDWLKFYDKGCEGALPATAAGELRKPSVAEPLHAFNDVTRCAFQLPRTCFILCY
jgi:hypothetical protein